MVRLASEQIANNLGAAEMLSGPCVDAARIIERHLSPVVLAAEAAARLEEVRDIRRQFSDTKENTMVGAWTRAYQILDRRIAALESEAKP